MVAYAHDFHASAFVRDVINTSALYLSKYTYKVYIHVHVCRTCMQVGETYLENNLLQYDSK